MVVAATDVHKNARDDGVNSILVGANQLVSPAFKKWCGMCVTVIPLWIHHTLEKVKHRLPLGGYLE